MEENDDKKQRTASAAEDPVRAQNEALARPNAYKTNSIAAYTPAGVIKTIASTGVMKAIASGMSDILSGSKPAY
jgi:hypothetical protein